MLSLIVSVAGMERLGYAFRRRLSNERAGSLRVDVLMEQGLWQDSGELGTTDHGEYC